MQKGKILFIDDDTSFGDTVVKTLALYGYEAHYQSTLLLVEDVVRALKPEVIVLDVSVGQKNSIDSIAEIKMVAADTPIIFVSSHTDHKIIDKAIKAGGSVYLKKPFDIEELITYIEANIQKHSAKTHAQISNTDSASDYTIGKFHFKSDDFILYYGSNFEKQLTSKEFGILRCLTININKIVTKENILKEVWRDEMASEHSLTNFIQKLRAILSKDSKVEITTISGVGYRLSTKKRYTKKS